ncbi:Fibulin-1 [Tupaia chinensis]|uniref:Fibulin-1 n=1 Tax=Tupaia chinensis TaxID=246437 RepID=L8Y8H6_TUPCH|nr:Fibulin-1 [Tupaia chinensis]
MDRSQSSLQEMPHGTPQRRGLRPEKTDTIRCFKSCRPSDVTCVLDPVHTISHTVVSLPTFREFTRPEEIIFLRAVTPLYSASQADIIFDITEGNLRDSFDIIKRYMDGMTVGEWPGTSGLSSHCRSSVPKASLRLGAKGWKTCQDLPTPTSIPPVLRAQL